MSSDTYIPKPILTARDAIASHVRWKITLLTAARMREPLSARATRSIRQPEQCAIRRWLLSDYTASLRHRPEYTLVLDRHIDFHREMQRVAHLLNTGHYAEAEELLASHSAFEQTSHAIAHALMALDRAHRLQPPFAPSLQPAHPAPTRARFSLAPFAP